MTQPDLSKRMGFFEHIEEMRVRLFKCAVVFFVGFILSYFLFTEPVLDFLKAPLFAVLPEEQQKLYFTNLFENFLTHLKIAAYVSIALFSPFYFFQIWAFIAPGLHENEKKYALPFIVSGCFFFLLGASFAYYVLFPVAFQFFTQFGAPSDIPILTIDSYYGTCLKLMLLFGLSFEFPVLICFLGFLGIVSGEELQKHRKTAILAITIGSALFAPPDAISMLILMIPLLLMYEASILVVKKIGRRKIEDNKDQDIEPSPWRGQSRED